MGLWPKRCVAGTARLDFAGSEPAGGVGGLPPHCRRIAALPFRAGSRAVAPWWLPSVGTSPWPAGNQVWPVGVALAGCPRFALARMSPRRRPPSPPVRFVSHGTCRVFTRRSRVRVPRSGRRCAASLMKLGPVGPTSPLRSELAGKWRRLWATPGNARKCVRERLESACARYGRAGEAPCHSGGAAARLRRRSRGKRRPLGVGGRR